MTEQEELKWDHRLRVTQACTLAVIHASALLSQSMQEFVDDLTKRLDREADCTVKINRLKRGLAKSCPDFQILRALEKLLKLAYTERWVGQRDYFDLLILCWNGVAENIDRKNNGDGSLPAAERAYQKQVVVPLIEASFRTLWAAQADLKKSARKLNSEPRQAI